MRVHYLQHVPFESSSGSVEAWAQARGHELTTTRLYVDDALPAPEYLGLLVILGGPMNVDEEHVYAWLAAEKRFIRSAVEHGLPVLGLCLGAQLLAAALGASVRQHAHPEIGWFPIAWTPAARAIPWLSQLPAEMTVLHWHGDTLDFTPEMQLLASSAGCAVQAFSAGPRVLGLQFHLEVTPETLASMLAHEAADLIPGPWVQPSDALASEQRYFADSRNAMFAILDGLTGGVAA